MTALRILPTDAAFADLAKDEQTRVIFGLLENFLDHVAATGRTLDDWEINAFTYTISCLRLGAISSALPEVKRLVTPDLLRPTGRVPVQKYPPGIAALRQELDGLALQ